MGYHGGHRGEETDQAAPLLGRLPHPKKGDFLGTVQAPDREAAEQAAVERFQLTDQQRKQLVLTEMR